MTQKFISSAADLPPSADVIVIGGGPAGTAALWAIERMAPGTKTLLLERSDRLGAGSTTASLENFRTCWPALPLAKQMQRSMEVFHNADEYLGEGAAQSIAAKEHGYLFCAFNEKQAAGYRADVERLHAIGLKHIEYLDAGEVAARFGWVGDKVIGAKYDPVAGWLDSNALIYRYAASTKAAQIVLGAQDIQIQVDGGKVTGVRFAWGAVSAPKVVIAAGAFSRAIGRTAGVEIPIIIRPRQSFTTGWRHAEFPEDAPMLISAAPHVRPEARDGAIFGWEYNWKNKYVDPKYGSNKAHDAIFEPVPKINDLKDPRFPSVALMLLAEQFGHQDGEGFGDSHYLRGISHNIGYYVYRDETTAYHEDGGTRRPYDSERAIIDEHPEVSGLFLSVAHVGHGIMTSPASGEILASKVLGLPLPDPAFSQFGLDANWVEYDESVL
jgi:glycine/D-amino acid oxidase-like deaminating enzyme